ncbi:MAG: carbohydrate-binding domain-containing protein, partial [Clostridia bacterium]|nr:carbohydrate-binding domain-containing protein [Clostridia bacterium]
MKKTLFLIFSLLLLVSCSKAEESALNETVITLSDGGIKIDGVNEKSVEVKNDIIYYEDGHDYTYGEGEKNDAHSKEEANEHTVVHITKAGDYRISGKLSRGQIAIDLGDGAKKDPEAVVTLILDGVDITSTVAPAIIFYNVYECADKDNPTKDVDTSKAGANVIINDGSVNTVNGSYVAKIYDPDTVIDGNIDDAKKLHKYDAAFYSRRSINIGGNGILNINAENEGLDSEMHLTINGGEINIKSGNYGINTNEDGVSVTTINKGTLTIQVTGETGEGDGIDSNGWLVINEGTVISSACASSADAGIDSDMGIHINGGTVIATGNMLDRIEEGGQTFAVFRFREKEDGGIPVTLKNGDEEIFSHLPENAYSVLVYSSPKLKEGTYNLYLGEEALYGYIEKGEGGMPPHDVKPLPKEDAPSDFERIPKGDGKHDSTPLPEGERPENKKDEYFFLFKPHDEDI